MGRGSSGEHRLDDTDKPFQALAAAKALVNGGPCHIPIQMDGTCNALQHYAALARNKHDAEMVNLVPSDTVSDPYQRIATLVAARVAKAADDGDAISKLLDGYVTRAMIKQPCMTTLYGVTQIGARKQVGLFLGFIKDRKLRYKASKLLVQKALRAMGDVCPSARAVMKYLTGCARAVVDTGRLVS